MVIRCQMLEGSEDPCYPIAMLSSSSGPGALVRQLYEEAPLVDDEALVEAGADLVALVAAGHLEAQPTAVHLGEHDGGRRLHADRRRGGVAEIDVGANRRCALQQMASQGAHAG